MHAQIYNVTSKATTSEQSFRSVVLRRQLFCGSKPANSNQQVVNLHPLHSWYKYVGLRSASGSEAWQNVSRGRAHVIRRIPSLVYFREKPQRMQPQDEQSPEKHMTGNPRL